VVSSGVEGRVTLITGATGGVGPAVAAAFAQDGATVVAAGRSQAGLADLRTELGLPAGRWAEYAVDLADPAASQALVDAIVARFGRVDILVAVAGGWRGGETVEATDPGTLDWLLRTNLLTAFNVCRAVLPVMQSNGWGRIVTIGARSAVSGQARSGAYAASKAALIALTQSIALETRNQGVTANVMLASTIDTPANRASRSAADPDRWVTPAQVAAAIRFLCSEEAAAISGVALPVYGRA
jgi:NAD(P)-dependent dehydrogenase (short-subunit alcohol dehydrogenase family)